MKDAENLKPYELIEELEKWYHCHMDQKDNYDARLLKKAADTILELIEKSDKLEDMIDMHNENRHNRFRH